MGDTDKNRQTKRKRRGRFVRKLVGWLVLLGLLAGAFYLFVWPQLNAAATTTYNSYTATTGSISNSMSFSGSISVVNNETLTSEAAATVRRIYVAEGDSVTFGQKLMRLSDGELIKSGFDGEVNEISVDEGDEVAANADLIQIVDFGNLKVSMRVDEYSVSKVSVGQACEVTVTALGKTLESTITHINRIASGGNATAYYTVTAEFASDEQVLPGMQVTVTIPEEEANGVVVLNRSALSFGAGNSAYVLTKNDAGEMVENAVTLGVDNDNFVEIKSGLAEGDVVYVKVENTADSAGGLASLFSSLTGASTTEGTAADSNNTGGRPDMSNFTGIPGGGNFSGGPGNR
jgi:HlyD family secretion protein